MDTIFPLKSNRYISLILKGIYIRVWGARYVNWMLVQERWRGSGVQRACPGFFQQGKDQLLRAGIPQPQVLGAGEMQGFVQP